MKRNKKDLAIELSLFIKGKIIDEKRSVEATKRACGSELAEKMPPAKIGKIFILTEPLEMMSEEDLCALVIHFNKYYNLNIDVEDWFVEKEINAALKLSHDKLIDGGNVVFKDVIFNGDVNNPVYRCFVTYKQIEELSIGAKLSYNTAAQRIGTSVSRGATTVTMPTIIEKSILQIGDLVAEGNFKSNDIILNILKKDDIKRYNYDANTRTLTVNEDITMDIADGAHRYFGILKGLEMCPGVEGSIGLTIQNLTIEEAGNLVYQIAQTNEHNKELISKYDEKNPIPQFIKKLNTMYGKQDNFLYQKIDFQLSNAYGAPIIKYDILVNIMTSNGMVDFIRNNSASKKTELQEFIVSFITLFADVFKEEKPEYENVLNTNNFLCGLIHTAFELFDRTKNVKVNTVRKIVNNFDFEKYDYTLEKADLNFEGKKLMRDMYTLVLRNIKKGE